MADPTYVARLAAELIDRHLPGSAWAFGFDNAKRRAGACHYSRNRITVSRYLSAEWPLDDVRQVLLHEIAHALAGHAAAHGPRWRAAGARIGYTGSRLHDGPIATEHARWVGECPGGHVHYRFRRPTQPMSCGLCAKRFSRAALITWSANTASAAGGIGPARAGTRAPSGPKPPAGVGVTR